MQFKTRFMIFLIFIFSAVGLRAEVNHYQEKKISIDLQNVNTQDALHILAKFIHMNVVISPEIGGVVSLYLHDSEVSEAFDLLLATHHLTKWKIGKTWFIASRAELVQRKQEEHTLQVAADEAATMVTRVWQIHYAKAEDVAHLLQDNTSSLLSPRGRVRVDARTNMICIQDIETRMQELDRLVRRLDVPVQQVLISARLASVDSNFERELGVNFSVQDPVASGYPSVGRYSLAVAKLADGSLLDIRLAALENEGHGEIISNPSLFTANQQTASIESGEEIPYQEVSLSGGTSIVFKKAVLSLKVTPQILPGNKVLLQLQVNQDKPSKRIVLGVPAISTRQMITNVLVNNGQTIVLGGIYETDRENDQQRIPFLGKIPLVGFLFRQQNISDSKRELLIFVTPKIVG